MMRELQIRDIDPSDLDSIAGGDLSGWVIEQLIDWNNGGSHGCGSNCQPPEGWYLEITDPTTRAYMCQTMAENPNVTSFETMGGTLYASDC